MKKMCRRILSVALTLLLLSSSVCALELTGAEEYAFMHDLVDFISENAKFPKSEAELLDVAFRERLTNPSSGFNGMVAAVMGSLDEHSSYMDEETYKTLIDKSVVGSFTGIGVSIIENHGDVVVVSAFPGSPAEAAGILTGDILIAVDDENLEGRGMDAIKEKIVGKEGTSVKVTVRRGEEELSFTMVRAALGSEPVTYEIMDGVGYLRFTSFNPKVTEDVGAAVAFFEKEGVEDVIIDIRDNSGGELNSALDISRMFTPKGVIMRVEYGNPDYNQLYYNEENNRGRFNLVVLVNGGSASASELFAGAVQDTSSGTIIGTKTFGKGTVQTVRRIITGGGIRLTVAEYKTAGGRAVHHEGVMPDVYVENTKTPQDFSDMLPMDFVAEWKKGDSGEGILAIEQRLAFLGFMEEADTVYDAATEAALRAFQVHTDLTVTGNADIYTQIELNAIDYTAPVENDDQLARALEFLHEAA